MDSNERQWTLMDSKTLTSWLYGLSWTSLDTAWRSTDQEVGCSSRPGRAGEIRVVAGDFTSLCWLMGSSTATFGSPSPDRTSSVDHALATDTHYVCRNVLGR